MSLSLRGLVLTVVAFSASASAELPNADEIDAYLREAVEVTGIPGIVALVVDRDEILYSGAFGLRNVERGEPMRMDTIFRIASMTKPVAATAIMMLVEEGELSLDDPIARYVPSFAKREVIRSFDAADASYVGRPPATQATIRQLMSHSSGLAYPFASIEINALTAAGVDNDAMPLLYDPGTGWSYAGGIAIVGHVLERIEGVGLDTFMRDRLFIPLGMTDTSFIVPARKHDRVVTTQSRGADGKLVESQNGPDIRAEVSGDGGLQSTAADYAKFIQLFLNDGVAPNGKRLLSRETIREMTRNQLENGTVTLQDEPTPALARAFPLGAGRDGFGLGFQVTGQDGDAGLRALGSLSWAGIFNTEFWIDRETGIGAVLLMQYLPFYDDDAIETLIGFEHRLYETLR